ncbi:hypothetical protein KCU92_g141, partial [Aureobasidium melanogenum]
MNVSGASARVTHLPADTRDQHEVLRRSEHSAYSPFRCRYTVLMLVIVVSDTVSTNSEFFIVLKRLDGAPSTWPLRTRVRFRTISAPGDNILPAIRPSNVYAQSTGGGRRLLGSDGKPATLSPKPKSFMAWLAPWIYWPSTTRLEVEMSFEHLKPAATPQSVVEVLYIGPPSTCIDAVCKEAFHIFFTTPGDEPSYDSIAIMAYLAGKVVVLGAGRPWS